jgi:hypothetical protein
MAKKKRLITKQLTHEEVLEAIGKFVTDALRDPYVEYEVVIGIDPGAEGAIALTCGKMSLVFDIPTIKIPRTRTGVKIPQKKQVPGGPKTKTVKGYATAYDNPAICRMFKILRPVRQRVIVGLEISEPMIKGKFGNNPRNARLVGIAYGMWPLFLISKGYSLEEDKPATWKKEMKLPKEKKAVLQKARQRWPKAPLQRVEDHNRAEALFLAAWARQRRGLK